MKTQKINLRFVGSNIYLYILVFIPSLLVAILCSFVGYKNNNTEIIYIGVLLFFGIVLLLLTLAFFFFFIYYFYDDYILKVYPLKFKRKKIYYTNIIKAKYSTIGGRYDRPSIIILQKKDKWYSNNRFYIFSFIKRQNILIFLDEKCVPIEIKSDDKKEKRILKEKGRKNFFERKFPFYYGDKSLF